MIIHAPIMNVYVNLSLLITRYIFRYTLVAYNVIGGSNKTCDVAETPCTLNYQLLLRLPMDIQKNKIKHVFVRSNRKVDLLRKKGVCSVFSHFRAVSMKCFSIHTRLVTQILPTDHCKSFCLHSRPLPI